MVSKNARWDFQGYRKNDSLMILVLLQLFRIAPVCTLLVELLRTILQEKIWYSQMLRGTFRVTGKIAL
jgi:hypothetical protein